jgi:hypothetical protein
LRISKPSWSPSPRARYAGRESCQDYGGY